MYFPLSQIGQQVEIVKSGSRMEFRVYMDGTVFLFSCFFPFSSHNIYKYISHEANITAESCIERQKSININNVD